MGTKIVGLCDAAGRLLDFVLVPGQAHELAPSLLLLKRLPASPTYALADMACDARQFRMAAQAIGTIPVVPSRKGAKEPQPCPTYIYRHCNLIERCWSRLKEWRAIATRLRQDRPMLCRWRRNRRFSGLDQVSNLTKTQMRTDPIYKIL